MSTTAPPPIPNQPAPPAPQWSPYGAPPPDPQMVWQSPVAPAAQPSNQMTGGQVSPGAAAAVMAPPRSRPVGNRLLLATALLIAALVGALVTILLVTKPNLSSTPADALAAPAATTDSLDNPPTAPGDNLSTPLAATDRLGTSPTNPVDVLGTPVTATGSRVTAACFSFDMPEGFELDPDSESCSAAVAPDGADDLLTFTVQPFTDSATADEYADMVQQAKLELISSIDTTVNGLDAVELRFKDPYGLTHLRYIFNLPDNYLLKNGKPVGAFQIEGYASPEYEELLWPAILNSFQLEEPEANN